MRINAKGMHYQQLNELIQQAAGNKKKEITLDNVNGQRYIGSGLSDNVRIVINGVPGNDLAAFMDGVTVVVNSNAQDGIGNTMNAGKIIVYGDAGDIVGHSMRGGRIYIKQNAGYRVGIHMKSYKDLYPVIIIGGRAGDFLGEYMAGGLIVVLGLGRGQDESLVGNYCGTGMHGGTIYIRGNIANYQLGKEVKKYSLDKQDNKILRSYLKEHCAYFSLKIEDILNSDFVKLVPSSHRPYGRLYAY
jgi:glutamate synthase domain-containing protein 3